MNLVFIRDEKVRPFEFIRLQVRVMIITASAKPLGEELLEATRIYKEMIKETP